MKQLSWRLPSTGIDDGPMHVRYSTELGTYQGSRERDSERTQGVANEARSKRVYKLMREGCC